MRESSMPRDFFDHQLEEQRIVTADAATVRKAEKLIESCEQCNKPGAEIPVDKILDTIRD